MSSTGPYRDELVYHQSLQRGAHDELAHPQPPGESYPRRQNIAPSVLATFDLFTKALVDLARQRVAGKRIDFQLSRIRSFFTCVHLVVSFLPLRGIILNDTPNDNAIPYSRDHPNHPPLARKEN